MRIERAGSSTIPWAMTVVCALTFVAFRSLSAGPAQAGPAAAATPRTPLNLAEFNQMADQISNKGRWGKDDQLGSVNLITESKRKQAAGLVRAGVSVGMAHIPLTEKAADNPSPFGFTFTGGGDSWAVSYHGYAHSHMDAIGCHILYQDKMYNGEARTEKGSPAGCEKGGIQNLRNGVVTRGILIDIPRLRNLPYLEPGTPVFVEDIEAWEKKAGVKVSSGDAIFLRTGRWARREKLGPWLAGGGGRGRGGDGGAAPVAGAGVAGFHASVAPWLKARGVALVGSDAVSDVTPSLVEGVPLPVHTLALAVLAINLFDNLDLEAVGATAARLNRWEFMLSAAPLPVQGGTGGPLNPLAIF